MFFTWIDVECWTDHAPKLFNVAACIQAGLYNSQSVITTIYREGSCHKWFYMTAIGRIIRDTRGGWMSKIKADTIFIFSLVESTSIFSCETAIIFAIKDLFYSFFFFLSPIVLFWEYLSESEQEKGIRMNNKAHDGLMSSVNVFHHLSLQQQESLSLLSDLQIVFSLIGRKLYNQTIALLWQLSSFFFFFSSCPPKNPCLQMEGTPQSGHVQWVITERKKKKEEEDRCEKETDFGTRKWWKGKR